MARFGWLIQFLMKVSVYPKIDNGKILVTDIPKCISLSSFKYKKVCEKSFLLDKLSRKNDFMTKLSLIGSCQQVVMIN